MCAVGGKAIEDPAVGDAVVLPKAGRDNLGNKVVGDLGPRMSRGGRGREWGRSYNGGQQCLQLSGVVEKEEQEKEEGQGREEEGRGEGGEKEG